MLILWTMMAIKLVVDKLSSCKFEQVVKARQIEESFGVY